MAPTKARAPARPAAPNEVTSAALELVADAAEPEAVVEAPLSSEAVGGTVAVPALVAALEGDWMLAPFNDWRRSRRR